MATCILYCQWILAFYVFGFAHAGIGRSPRHGCPMAAFVDQCKVRRPVKQCFNDKQCTGIKICCETDCGGTECMVPKRKPGTCGPDIFAKCIKEDPIKCRTDLDCPGKNLCCRTPCAGSECRKGSKNKPVSCPGIPLIQCIQSLPRTCEQDNECKGKKKCCEIECGGTLCMKLKCKDNKKWRGTIDIASLHKCVKCNCNQLKNNIFVWLKACSQNVDGAKTNCCKTCKDFV